MTYVRLLALLITIVTFSCGKGHFHSESRSIATAGWQYADSLSYEFEIKDTSKRYDIGLVIVHSADFEYQNLYIQIVTQFPDGEVKRQSLPIDLADHTGQWYGACSRNSCDLTVMLQERAIFNQVGEHTFEVHQYMRVDPLPGLKAITFFLDLNSDA